MDNPTRVSVRQRFEKLDGYRRRNLRRHRPLILQEVTQGRTPNQLDDKVLLRFVDTAYVVNLDDVRVTQLGHRLSLRTEARGHFQRFAQMRMNDLDGHLASEPPIERAVHRRHPSASDLLADFVLLELGPPIAAGECLDHQHEMVS
jgi:hypothetical protein